jgi:hypothetical protein
MGAHKSNAVALAAKAGQFRMVYPGDDKHDVVSVEVVFVGSDGKGRLVKLDESDQMAIARTIIMAHNRRDSLGVKAMEFADVAVMPREMAETMVNMADSSCSTDPGKAAVIEAREFLGMAVEL